MAKVVQEKFTRKKPHCNIGTIGHVDHGKTTLTAAITKVLAKKGTAVFRAYDMIDKSVEERKRGITITASHVEYETEKRHYTHIDCPGHQAYIKNMITGATQMEGAILVVAITEGPQEQTREHVILSKEVGIPYMVVYANKLDAVTETDMKDFVEVDVRELVSAYGYPSDLPIIFGSARMALEESEETDIGTGTVTQLMNTVDEYIKQPERVLTDPLLMSIESVLAVKGRGTVVAGKIEKGSVKKDSDVEVVGAKSFITKCIGLEMYHKSMDMAQVGENVGMLLRGVDIKQVKRGYVVAQPGSIKASKRFEAKAYLLKKDEGGRHKPFYTNYKPQFYFRTANITGKIILASEDAIALPGETITFTVELLEPVAINEGLRFLMREGTITLGAGVIVKVL
jgi:elongation factor Tu